MGEILLREYSSGYSSNCDEAIFGVKKALLNMFWKYSPYLTNLASDWLRAGSSPVDEEERKRKKWMTVSPGTSLASEGICLLTCGRRSLVSGTQNDIVVS